MKTCALALCLLIGTPSAGYAAQAPRDDAEAPSGLSHRADGVDARRGPVLLRVAALTDEIIRVRIAREGALPEDASWAVLPDMRARHAAVTPIDNGFATRALRVTVDPGTLKINVTDPNGKPIVTDADEPVSFDGRAFTLRKALHLGEHIYGLGDKTGGTLDRRSKTYVDWNTDAYGFDSSSDPIYKSIPFFIGSGGQG